MTTHLGKPRPETVRAPSAPTWHGKRKNRERVADSEVPEGPCAAPMRGIAEWSVSPLAAR